MTDNQQPKQQKLTPEMIEIAGSVPVPINIESLPLLQLTGALCLAGLLAQGVTSPSAAIKMANDHAEALIADQARRWEEQKQTTKK